MRPRFSDIGPRFSDELIIIILRDVCLRYRLNCCKRLSPGCASQKPVFKTGCTVLAGSTATPVDALLITSFLVLPRHDGDKSRTVHQPCMDFIFLPQSTSALDRWSDRAIRIVLWEIVLAGALVLVASSYFPKPSEFEYDHPPMNKTKLAVAVPTIFLPLGSCMTSWLPLFRRVILRNFSRTGKDASTRVLAKPLTYSSFQILQLLACSFLAGHDFVILSARRPWFWFSLVGSFMPALAGTIYGLVGIARFLFSGSAPLTLHRYHSPTTTEEYSDAPIENCALESAYQQQLSNGIRHPELETNATAHEPGTARSQTQARDDQTRSQNPISPLTGPRFRWQEQSGARNGGSAFWTPMAAISSLLAIWGFYYKWLMRNAHYSPELIR